MSPITDPDKKPFAKKIFSHHKKDTGGNSDGDAADETQILLSKKSLDRASSFAYQQDKIVELDSLFLNNEIKTVLLNSNVFIFGKIGFFDLIISALSNIHKESRGKAIKLIKTEKEMITYSRSRKHNKMNSRMEKELRQEPRDNLSPIIIFPTADSDESLNQFLAAAFTLKNPLWVVALPSQLKRHLLLSFNCFFLTQGADEDFDVLSGITPAINDDLNKLKESTEIRAIFISDKKISDIGISNRLGTVIYINKIS
jgi:hypothetical protein